MCTPNSEVCDNLTTMGANADSDVQSPGELSARHEQRCVGRYCPMATTIRDQPGFIKTNIPSHCEFPASARKSKGLGHHACERRGPFSRIYVLSSRSVFLATGHRPTSYV